MRLLDWLHFRIATLFQGSQVNAEIEEELRSGFEAGALKPPTVEIVPFEQAVRAYGRIADRQTKLKQVLSFESDSTQRPG